MIAVNVHGYIDIHNVAILERAAWLEISIVSGLNLEGKRNSLVWNPVTKNIVDARTT